MYAEQKAQLLSYDHMARIQKRKQFLSQKDVTVQDRISQRCLKNMTAPVLVSNDSPQSAEVFAVCA